jgi:hypothetical protein
LSALSRFAAPVLLLWVAVAAATPYAGDFEELGTSARAIGMGGAVVAAADDASAIYYNPSLSSRFTRTSVLLLHSEEFSGLVKHNFIGASFASCNQSLGFAVLHNGIPGIKLTALPYPDLPISDTNRPYVTDIVSANDVVAYLNYSRRVAPALALGGNVKFIYRNLGVGSGVGMGVDLGATVTPFEDLDIGLRVRNASTAPLFWDTGTRDLITPGLAVGLARTFRFGRDKLAMSVESEIDPATRQFVPDFGLEYTFRNTLSGRLGAYRGNFSFGVGLRWRRFHVDYGYATGGAPGARELGSPQQISGGVEF